MLQIKKWIVLTMFSLGIMNSVLVGQVTFSRNTIDSYFGAYFMKATDLDKDGDQDIVAGHSELAWWENNGKGSFSKHYISGQVSALWSIFPVDIDRDGDLDLLDAESGNHVITWFRNNNWNFERIIIESNFTNAESVAGADLDGDGDIDITGLTYGTDTSPGIVAWWENNGSQQFYRRNIDLNFEHGHKIAVSDIDKDGDIDIIACAASSSGVSWYKNDGHGNFNKIVLYSNAILGIAVADMDNNGTLDILACEHGAGMVILLVHNGSGSFSSKVIASGLSWPSFAAPGDINGDGLLDAVVVNRDSNDMIWLENVGGNNFNRHTVDTGIKLPFVCDAADFDRDGDADPVTGSKDDNALWWWRTNSQNPPADYITVQSPNGGESWSAGDAHEIKWTWSGSFANVKIEYSANNGSSWSSIVSSTSNDGSYFWQIPNINSSQCLVKISEASTNSPADVSNSVFTIQKPQPITVTRPNGGETWSSNGMQSVEWTTDHSFDFVSIDFSSDAGASWSRIADRETNDGQYDWNIPNISSEHCIIKIMDADNPSVFDENDSDFSILNSSGNMVVYINCDDIYDLYVNNNYIGSNDQWDAAQEYILPILDGKNVLAVLGKNRGSTKGLIAEVDLDGTTVLITDTSWRHNSTLISGWTGINFDDSGWGQVTDLGQYGVSPWGKGISGFPSNSTAHWIWGVENQEYYRGSLDFGVSPPVEYAISGQCLYYSNSNAIPNATVSMSGDLAATCVTSATGDFSFVSIPALSNVTLATTKPLQQDVNSSTILSYDAALASRFSVGLNDLTQFQQVAADVDKNGQVTSFDAAVISRYAVALPPLDNTYAGYWEFRPESQEVNSISQDVTGILFNGILLGDVKGGWQMNLGKVSSANQEYVRNFLANNVQVTADTTTIIFDLPHEKQVISFDLQLIYDASEFDFIGYSVIPSAPALTIVSNSVPGDLRMGGYSWDFLKQDHGIHVHFANTASQSSGSIMVKKFIINNETIMNEVQLTTGLKQGAETVPITFHLDQNYPNPFNSETVIRYALPESGKVKISIFDVQGKLVRMLTDDLQTSGSHQVVWDGRDQFNRVVPSGIYFVRANFQNRLMSTLKINFLR